MTALPLPGDLPPSTHAAPPADQTGRNAPREFDHLEMSLVRMMLEYPAKTAVVEDSGVLACFRTGELRALGEELLAACREGRAPRDLSGFVGRVTEGPLRDRLLALLVQESPYEEALIDRLMADAVGQIRERSNREKGKLLTRRIKEAEKMKDQALYERLVAEKNRLLQEGKGRA